MAGSLPPTFLSVTTEMLRDDLAPIATSVMVEDHDRMVDELKVTFKDPDSLGASAIARGDAINAALGWEGNHAVLFEGYVVDVLPQAGGDGTRTLTVVARDMANPMTLEPKSRAHPPSSLQDLVKSIVAPYTWSGDLASITCDPNPTLTKHDDLAQNNVTDYKFLQDLAERWGGRAFVEYNDGKSKFYWVSTKTLLEGEPLAKLRYCRGTDRLIEFKYQSIAARADRQMVASAVDPVSGKVKTVKSAAPAADSSGGGKIVTPPPPAKVVGLPSDPQRAERETVFDPTRLLGLSGNGRAAGNINLRAKGRVTLVGLAPWAEGDWYISKATHIWKNTSTPEVPGSSYETLFEATR